MSANVDSHRLLARARDGDKAALGELLLGHHDALVVYLTPRMPDRLRHLLDVDDVLQETFAAAFRDIGKFEPQSEEALLVWLRAVAEHRLQDAIKLLGRKKRGGDAKRVTLAATDDASIARLVELVADGDPTASCLARRDEARRALGVAVSALPEDQRRVIQMRYYEGKDLESVARELGRTSGAVRALTDRAKKRLQELIGSLSHYLSSR